MHKEAQWVANHFNLESTDAPCESVFDALSRFAKANGVHFSTHGFFKRDTPTSSYLSLDKGRQLPLWTISAIQTSANLVMLSACESNLTGEDTGSPHKPVEVCYNQYSFHFNTQLL